MGDSMDNVSVYIHIPFCNSICTYCDFPKLYHDINWVNNYLDSLKTEINSKYKNEHIKTIYIGGGTPSSLSNDELNKLFNIIKIFNIDKQEFTFECNIENINEELLKLLKLNKVNRLSIGIETLNDKYLKFLGRKYNEEDIINNIGLAKQYFNNISVDLMYAFPNQTLDELEDDINKILSLNVNHISTYSLIIEPHTIIYNKGIKNIDSEIDADMYELIENKLKDYNHYEISNFGKKGYESKHNLTYWDNDHYYGFGLGASGYIDNIRYTNTRNMVEYIKGNYILEKDIINIEEDIQNEFILGLRKLDGINKDTFNKKYKQNINDIEIVKKLIRENKLIDNGKYISIRKDLIYISNSILVEFI